MVHFVHLVVEVEIGMVAGMVAGMAAAEALEPEEQGQVPHPFHQIPCP